MESLTRIDLPLIRIRAKKFCLRKSVEDSFLTDSVRQFGLLQPLTVVQNGKFYDCVSGHKRLRVLKKLKKKNECFISHYSRKSRRNSTDRRVVRSGRNRSETINFTRYPLQFLLTSGNQTDTNTRSCKLPRYLFANAA